MTLILISASRGCPRAQCALGYCYSQGFGCIEDHDNALKWWMLSAGQKNPVAYMRMIDYPCY